MANVLVSEAHTIGAIAVIRSLGRAGHTVTSASPRADALGFYSRFTTKRLQTPAYESGAFLTWLEQALLESRYDAIVASESFLHAARPIYERLAPLLTLSADEASTYGCLSKYWVHQQLLARGVDQHLPPSRLLCGTLSAEDEAWLLATARQFLKVDMDAQRRARVVRSESDRVLPDARKLLASYGRFLAQRPVPGIGVGACFLRWEGKVVASCMHRRLREVPYEGGVSSCREIWHHSAILADATAKLDALDWNGLAMLEYRWDAATDQFWFIELNSRVWGSMHLALYAGVDFPALVLRCQQGEPPAPAQSTPPHCRARLAFPLDAQHMLSVLRSREHTVIRKAAACARFFADFANPGLHGDLDFPGDRALAWRAAARYGRAVLG